MRLLRLIATLDPRSGGPLAAAAALTPPLAGLGMQTEFLTCDAPGSPIALDLPASSIHQLGPALGSFAYTTKGRPWLDLHHARHDLLVVHGLWQHSGWLARRNKRRHGTPYCVFPHGMLDPSFRSLYPVRHLKKLLFWRLLQASVLREADAVVFTSEEERLRARDAFTPYSCRERCIAYGAPPPPPLAPMAGSDFRARAGLSANEPYILFLSRLHHKKGLDLLLPAYAKVSAANPSLPRLVLAGPAASQSYLNELHQLAMRTGIAQRLLWPGMLDGPSKWAALQEAECLILPSHQENFGIVVAEALACSTPVLVSDKVNIWRDLLADKAGLVAPDTEEGCARLLLDWLGLPQEERHAMRLRAQACFQGRYEIGSVAHSMHALFTGLARPAPTA